VYYRGKKKKTLSSGRRKSLRGFPEKRRVTVLERESDPERRKVRKAPLVILGGAHTKRRRVSTGILRTQGPRKKHGALSPYPKDWHS